jgi:HAMP domain-containing protein
MTHLSSHSSLVLTVLQNVPTDRLQRAVTALADGSFTMTLTRQTPTEIRALVQTHTGQQYGMALTEAVAVHGLSLRKLCS